MTPPPRKYADAPGTASSVAEISPPADDSATATVCLRSLSSAPSAAAIARSLVGMEPMIARRHPVDLSVPAGRTGAQPAQDDCDSRWIAAPNTATTTATTADRAAKTAHAAAYESNSWRIVPNRGAPESRPTTIAANDTPLSRPERPAPPASALMMK